MTECAALKSKNLSLAVLLQILLHGGVRVGQTMLASLRPQGLTYLHVDRAFTSPTRAGTCQCRTAPQNRARGRFASLLAAAARGSGRSKRSRNKTTKRPPQNSQNVELQTLLNEYASSKQLALAAAAAATLPEQVVSAAAATPARSRRSGGAVVNDNQRQMQQPPQWLQQQPLPPGALDVAGGAARLAAAQADLAAAEQHVQGLARLLLESQSTLNGLRQPLGEPVGPGGVAPAAAPTATEKLMALMSDVLTDITAEMGLVGQQLLAAREDIGMTRSQLEAAAAAAAQHSATPPHTGAPVATEVQALRAALELRDAELAVAQHHAGQLQAQLDLLQPSTLCEMGGGATDGSTAAGGVEPAVRQLLVQQVGSNMALLEWLGVLAKNVVDLDGVRAEDRARLASSINRCVLAVGGGESAAAAAAAAAGGARHVAEAAEPN
jgi:hypothetical protein